MRAAQATSVSALMVASRGGHLTQLCRLARLMGDTATAKAVLVTPGQLPIHAPDFATVERCGEFSRENAWRALASGVHMWRLVSRYRPHVIVTTGAAPGLIAVVCGRLRGVHCLWLDSLANTRRLSLSGRLARFAGAEVLSQWPQVARHHGVEYHGSLL